MSGQTAAFGTDDSAAIQAACNAVNVPQGGGTVELAACMYMVGTRIQQHGGTIVRGQGIDYNGDDPFPLRGTVVVAAGSLTDKVWRMATTQKSGGIEDPPFDSGNTMPQMHDMACYGSDICTSALEIVPPRWKVSRCQFGGGNTQAVYCLGQNGEMTDCIINGHSRGAGIVCMDSDNSFSGNQIRGWRTIGFDAQGSNGQFKANKIYCNNTESLVATTSFRVGSAGWTIEGNVFGDSDMSNPHISMTASTSVRDVNIIGNFFYHAAVGSIRDAAIEIDTTSAATRGINVVGNSMYCLPEASGNDKGYAALVSILGANAVDAWTMVGNTCVDATTLWTAAGSQRPSSSFGNTASHSKQRDGYLC